VNPGAPFTGTPGPLTVGCPLPSAQVNVPYNSALTATGGTPPYTYSVTGSLPAGLNLTASTGAIGGTPTGGSATFTANVQDSELGTNGASCTITVAAAGPADVSISKTGPATAAPGSNVTYNITVSNLGPNSAAGVTVTDVLPPGTTFVSATPSQGSCSGTSTVSCSLVVMSSGGTATIAIVLKAPNSGSVSNTATVSSTTADLVPANNSSTAPLTVIPPVPALSTWGLGGLALLLAGLSAKFSRRASA